MYAFDWFIKKLSHFKSLKWNEHTNKYSNKWAIDIELRYIMKGNGSVKTND